MAEPKDRVHLIKQEWAATGGDPTEEDLDFLDQCPLEPNEDAPMVAGLFIQPPSPSTDLDEEVFISRDAAGNMCFKDENTPEVPLSALFGLLPLEKLVFTEDLCIVIVGCDYVTTDPTS